MPLYEFMCRKCSKRFEASQSLGEHAKAKPRCPECKSARAVEPELSTFFAQTSRKS
jgi:putative FmdB family regulatory protein